MQKRETHKKVYIRLAALVICLGILLIIFIFFIHSNSDISTAIWSRQQAQNFVLTKENTAPYIDPNFKLAAPDLWIWDTWPLTKRDGSAATINGYKVIFALTAPRSVGWNERHDFARISYFYSKNGRDWTCGGPAYNLEDALGSRQWAGSAMLDENRKVQFFYTATGRKGEAVKTSEQRLAKTTFDISADKNGVHLSNWSKHQIILESDGVYYQTMQQAKGPIIYSFRDPFFFKDPKTGKEYLLFEGNKGGDNQTLKPKNIGDELFRKTYIVPSGAENFNGNIGIAVAEDKDLTKFKLLPPVLEAAGVNQQLERPHVVVKGNQYYLFISSHRFTYAPGLDGPDGLYGFVGDSLRSDYKPLNGNGLVITNPANDPYQAYSWYVMPGGSVMSFINEYHINGQLRYGGTFAPTLQISLTGDKSKITGELVKGGSLTFAKENGSMDYKETYGISHITRYDMLKIPGQQNSAQFKVPQFHALTIKNIPSAKGYDEYGNLIGLDVWNSWPLQNADGTVANYHGYHIVFALAGDPKRGWDTHIYLFYQKIGDTSIDSWKNAGRVFKDSDKFVPNDPILKNQSEEWSGSATLTSDGKIRLFYTDRDSWSLDSGHYGKQTLTTAKINLSQLDVDTLKIDGVEDLKSIFDGRDGTIYQNVMQGFEASNPNTNTWDNHALRDPHYVEDNGHKYLVFEANTGTTDGYQGDESLYNRAYYGGSETFFQTEKNKLLQSPKKNDASLANGALGILELNNDYTVKNVMKPLITSNTVTDEIERANVFKMNGKWYLFTDSRGAKMTIDGIGAKDVYMLGYVSDSLTGPYHPLNESGLVLNMNLDPTDQTFTYSHFAVPQPEGNNVVITSYITNRGFYTDHKSTFAPSFLLNIQGPKTSVVPNSILPQGQLTIGK